MKLCPFCMRRFNDSDDCPFCGYNGSQTNTFRNSLPLNTKLADRYIIGGVCGTEEDFISYNGLDSSSGKRVKLTEYLPAEMMYRKETRTYVSFFNIECRSRAEAEVISLLEKCRLLCRVGMNGFLDICDCFEENGTVCFVSKIRDGSPLSTIIGNDKPISIGTTLVALDPVFSCVEQLHSAGLYHGSVSPYNIICSKGKTVSLGGLSFAGNKNLSPYDAPEREACEQVGAWTDIYSLGAIVYEMVTGYLPVSARLRKDGRELKYPDSVDPRLRNVINKAMSMNPNMRYHSVSEFVAALKGKESENSQNDAKKHKKNSGATDIIRTALLVVSIVCFIVSAGLLVNKYIVEPFRFLKQSKELFSLASQSQNDLSQDAWNEIKNKYPNVDFPAGMNIDFADIYARNTDFAGWITIRELGIDYSLVQADDNEKYVRTDFYGNSTQYGQPFFDSRNDLIMLDRNTVIYGHNMRHDDRLFGPLEEYKTVDGFEKAPIITVKTLYDTYYFKVWAAFITNSLEEDDNGHVFNYIFINTDNASFENYINEVEKRRLYSTCVDILPTDKILTLSTCCYEFSDARLVVVGRLVRDGESVSVDTSLAAKNTSPKYPQAFYDAIKTTNPYKDDPDLFS